MLVAINNYLLFLAALGSLDKDVEWNVGLEEAVGNVVYDGLAQLSSKVLGLATHVVDGLLQRLSRLLAAHVVHVLRQQVLQRQSTVKRSH